MISSIMKSVIAKINLAAQNSDEAEKKASNSQMNQISAVPAQIPVDQLLIRSGPSNDNPFSISTIAQPSSISTNSNRNTIPGSNNPFGDSFSQLNDNDLFGLEFDWIRQNNSNSSLNLGKYHQKFNSLGFFFKSLIIMKVSFFKIF